MGLDDPVAVVVEGAGVEKLVFRFELAAASVLREEIRVGELALRIVVAPAVPRMARQRVEVPPVLLCFLAVIALIPGVPEEAFLLDLGAGVPAGERETEKSLDIGEAAEAVLTPTVRARARVVVR